MPPGDPPDDENHDWFDGDPTHADPRLAETSPHRSLDYLTGRERGFTEGVDAVLWEVGAALLDSGLTPQEASLVVLRVQLAALDMG